MEFVIKYWGQIAVLLGLVGYILKGLWDFRIKRMEIQYSHLFKERLTAISSYLQMARKCLFSAGALAGLAYKRDMDSYHGALTEYYDTFHEYQKAYMYALLLVPQEASGNIHNLNDIIVEYQERFRDIAYRIKNNVGFEDQFNLNDFEDAKSEEANQCIRNIITYFQKISNRPTSR